MTPLPQKVVMGNLHDVAETSTVATAGVAAACAICAAAAAAAVVAAAAAAVKMLLQYVGMNANCCMLKVIVYLTGGYTVSYVHHGESVQRQAFTTSVIGVVNAVSNQSEHAICLMPCHTGLAG